MIRNLNLNPPTAQFEVPPPSEKIAGGFQQAGKKEGGLGEGIFARLLSAPKARQGWEAARPCSSKEAKPAKIVSLIEKEFCARPLKEKEIFAGFVSAFGGASRWGGFLPVRAENLDQKRTKSKISFLSSMRRFGAAKPPEQKHTIKRNIEMFLLSNFFRVPLCGTTKPVF